MVMVRQFNPLSSGLLSFANNFTKLIKCFLLHSILGRYYKNRINILNVCVLGVPFQIVMKHCHINVF